METIPTSVTLWKAAIKLNKSEYAWVLLSVVVEKVPHSGQFLNQGKFASWTGAGAPMYLAAVLEYLMANILEMARNAACDNKNLASCPVTLHW